MRPTFHSMVIVFALLAIALQGSPVHAVTFTCTGSADGTAINSLIWTPAVAPMVQIEPGNCSLDIPIFLRSGLTLKGAGVFATKLTLVAGQTGTLTHAIQGNPSLPQTNISISDFSIDQNRSGQSQGHAIRFGSNAVDNIRIERISVQNADQYGIGFQDGTFTRIVLDDIQISNTGLDGIDFKNSGDSNSEIILNNIRIRQFGQDEQSTPQPVSGQAGIDLRGQFLLSNVWVSDVRADLTGIRFRSGESSSTNGVGGRRSSLTNFRIDGSSGVGISLENRDNNVSNGYIRNVAVGIQVVSQIQSGIETKAINNSIGFVECVECTLGLRTQILNGASSEMNTRITAFRSRHVSSSGTGIIIDGNYNVLVGAQVQGAASGIEILTTATGTVLKGSTVNGNTVNITNNGVSTEID